MSESNTRGPAVRCTRQKMAIAAALRDITSFVTAQELHAFLLRRGEQVGLATVYRCLQTLSDAEQVDVLRTANGETAYRRCSPHHHHHLVCRSCGHTVEVTGPGLERWADSIATAHGYTDVSHTLEIFGSCPDCTRKSSPHES